MKNCVVIWYCLITKIIKELYKYTTNEFELNGI